ncbi:hypothetical protein NDGK_02258 [Clostridiales bacterium CHKCI001]|nr:hypothetical protein NDGK_02258 [Clostridiales bacterium CHKCI001]
MLTAYYSKGYDSEQMFANLAITKEKNFKEHFFMWNKNVKVAIQQMKEKKYSSALKHCTGDILLVGINYDKKNKEHGCVIEKFE